MLCIHVSVTLSSDLPSFAIDMVARVALELSSPTKHELCEPRDPTDDDVDEVEAGRRRREDGGRLPDLHERERPLGVGHAASGRAATTTRP